MRDGDSCSVATVHEIAMRRLFSAVLIVTAVVSQPPSLHAQDSAGVRGRVTGKVLNTVTGERVPSAQVTVEGTPIAAITNWAGEYTLAGVSAGLHTVSVRAIGYASKFVAAVSVQAGATTLLDVTLGTAAVELEGITVTAEQERGSVSYALNQQRTANQIINAVTAEQIAKSPDSDAGQAVQRVSGVTVQDGRYVFVRGLGERYTTTALNGARIPSPEPERKVVPLDLFPSGLLEGITTYKTFTPDQPGDFSGASSGFTNDRRPTNSSLWVLRGAKIIANGTAAAPIVFTSARAAGNRKPGDWGGMVVIGNGLINRTGVINTEGPAGVAENYGGGTDNADSSGVLRYVRIEFAGFDVSGGGGSELNGLSMYAVGSRTKLE
ncbi:MAG: carboxypeptidase regulatory-like domain-containing protein [Gemmatimonadales bacterium]